MIFTNRYYSAAEDDFSSDEFYEKAEKTPRVLGYCEHCGFEIYSARDALVVNESEDLIHIACWGEYSQEHMFDFAQRASDAAC
ncbi:MAG: hypothetical protein IJX55_11340 [Clostridia bacterium]|nr:hypothetical protein [Clostridia bacterium]